MQNQCLFVLLSTYQLTSDVITLLVFSCKWQTDIVIISEMKMVSVLPCKKNNDAQEALKECGWKNKLNL